MDSTYLLLYLPVLHQGYIEMFKRCAPEIHGAYVFGKELVEQLQYRGREIRALEPEVACQVLQSLKFFPVTGILSPEQASRFNQYRIVMPCEGMSHRFAEKYLPSAKIQFDTAFLRWDETNVFSQKPVNISRTSENSFDREMMERAVEKRRESSDWWRQVGALVVRDGKPVFGCSNQHLPTEHTPYIHGDPRDAIEAGKHSELCSAIHAEQAMIVEAARMFLEGSDVYVTTFPCPVCAKLLAHAGIRRLFFRSGHAALDGQTIMESHGVEIIHVP